MIIASEITSSCSGIKQFKPPSSKNAQCGASQGWMLLTIGVIVGFVLGFVLFLSRMPQEHYTLVETERAVETYEAADPSQFGFYDNLPDVENAVPNVRADQMPAFTRNASNAGGYGAGLNERPSAVQIAEEFNDIGNIKPIETVASVGGAVGGGVVATRTVASGANGLIKPQRKGGEIQEPTIVKKVPNAPKTFYYLQAGAFNNRGEASAMQSSLRGAGMDAFIHKVRKDGKLWHRVRIGPFYDSSKLRRAQQSLGQNGLGYLVIKVQS